MFKHYPLDFHKDAKPAAVAAVAAMKQGKFWEFHDLVFKNQKEIGAAKLEEYAKQAGLDLAKWQTDMKDPSVDKILARDKQEAERAGVSGTPTMFLNGRKIKNAPQTGDGFVDLVRSEILEITD